MYKLFLQNFRQKSKRELEKRPVISGKIKQNQYHLIGNFSPWYPCIAVDTETDDTDREVQEPKELQPNDFHK